MKIIGLLMATMFLMFSANSAPPTRSDVYVSQSVIDPAAVTRNEDAIFSYLQAGIDTIANNIVTSAHIKDGEIVNADISSGAAIADNRIVDALTIDGGTVNNSIIGGSTPAAGTFTALTTDGLTLGQDENITLGSQTLDHDGTDFVFNDSIKTTTLEITGGQIKFPASQSASADANTLDDYEEGEHNPTVVCSSSGSYTLSAGSDTLAYTKIGRVVHIQGKIVISSESTPVGELRVSLPFAVTNLTEVAEEGRGSLTLTNHGGTIPNGVYAFPASATSFFEIVNIADNGTPQTIDKDDVDTAWELNMEFSYISE